MTVFILFLSVSSIINGQTDSEDNQWMTNTIFTQYNTIDSIPTKSLTDQAFNHSDLLDGNTRNFKNKTFENPVFQQSNKKEELRESGYFNISELNFGIGIGKSKQFFSYGLQTINGYLFNPYFSLGVGIGIDKYDYATLLPIFIDARINPIKNFRPLVFAGAVGYALDFSGYSDGFYKGYFKGECWGIYVNPSLSLRFPVFSKSDIDISVGIRLQENTVYYLNMVIPRTQRLINLKIGFKF